MVFGNENTRFKVDLHLEADDRSKEGPSVFFKLYDREGLGGKGVCANLKLATNQRVTFIAYSGQSGIPQDNLGQYIKTLDGPRRNSGAAGRRSVPSGAITESRSSEACSF